MIATVAGLYRYPVKGLRGHAVSTTAVERCGFAGDRRWMVVDPDGRFITQRECTRMATVAVHPLPEGIVLAASGMADQFVPIPVSGSTTVTVWRSTVAAVPADETAERWLSELLGRCCRLVYMADPEARPVDPAYGRPADRVSFADGFPVLLAATASLDDLNARLDSPVPIGRFRPNLVIADTAAWAEDGWRRIRVGEVVFRLPKSCTRCIVTSVDQETGERPHPREPLRTLATFRRGGGGVMFGQNMVPEAAGRIAVGDVVELLEAGSAEAA